MTSPIASLLILLAVGAPARGAELRVKASPAVSPCVLATKPLYERAFGRRLVVETALLGPAASATGADVAVGAEEELTRVIESGASRPDLDVDVARIPWVLVGPARDAAPDLNALDRSTVRVRILGGTVGREARRSLQHLPPERLASFTSGAGPVQLAGDEVAVVPLSLAGNGQVSALSLPPLAVRAVGVRASADVEGTRRFLEFLSQGPGNAAFRACGREGGR